MELRKAKGDELDTAMALIDQAKAFLKQQGVDQWQSGYPDRDCIAADIAAEKGYFCVEDGTVAGYLCIDFDGEPAYASLNGTWLTQETYVVVHRMALDDRVKGRGLASRAFALVEELARGKGVHSFKVDTDRDNRTCSIYWRKTVLLIAGRSALTTVEKSPLKNRYEKAIANRQSLFSF